MRLTQDYAHEDGAPSRSPDEKWIAFEAHLGEDEDLPSALWVIAVLPGWLSAAGE